MLAEARRLAGAASAGGRVVAMSFHPHPMTTLAPAAAPAMLTPIERRTELLRAAGADEVIRLAPERELLSLDPRAFFERVLHEQRPAAFVEGSDFRFGRGRAGDVGVLSQLGREKGIEVSIVPPVEVALCDQTMVTASSTIARWLVARGRVADARAVLGREYELIGEVERGDRRGREIGFPTANLRTDGLLPADAVYAGTAHLPDGRALPAAIHVGTRSTFNDTRRTVEAYVIDWAGPVADGWAGSAEYGWRLRLSFRSWLRDQARFESVGSLIEQIRRDVERSRPSRGARAGAISSSELLQNS